MKSIKALFGLFVVVAGFYVSWKVIPPYFNNYQFQDELESQARLNSYTTKSEQEIRDIVIKKAREFDIPLQDQQVTVQRAGSELSISADYTIHVDLPVYPLDLHFTPGSKNRRM